MDQLPLGARRSILSGMGLDLDTLADLEGDALAMLDEAGAERDRPPSMRRLCEQLLRSTPERAQIREEADRATVLGVHRIFVRHRTSAVRARFLVAHELAEWWHGRAGYREADREERCDAMAAMLLAPRPAFQRAMRAFGGHRVLRLADAFEAAPSLALLRIGEVTGRSVILLRKPTPIARGADFGWPSGRALERAVRDPPPGVHPIELAAERRWGLMAA